MVVYGLSLLGGAVAQDAVQAFDPPLWMMVALGAGDALARRLTERVKAGKAAALAEENQP
jgi:hypothetical protein